MATVARLPTVIFPPGFAEGAACDGAEDGASFDAGAEG